MTERRGRGRPNRIDGLPALGESGRAIKERIDRGIRSGRTLEDVRREANEAVEALGEPPLSRSGTQRYGARLAADIREARQIAAVTVAAVGDAPDDADIPGLVTEALAAKQLIAVSELQQPGEDGDWEAYIGALAALSLVNDRLARAGERSFIRSQKLRAAMADEAAAEARAAGIGEDHAERIREALIGRKA